MKMCSATCCVVFFALASMAQIIGPMIEIRARSAETVTGPQSNDIAIASAAAAYAYSPSNPPPASGGDVISVNGQTGVVVVTADSLDAATSAALSAESGLRVAGDAAGSNYVSASIAPLAADWTNSVAYGITADNVSTWDSAYVLLNGFYMDLNKEIARRVAGDAAGSNYISVSIAPLATTQSVADVSAVLGQRIDALESGTGTWYTAASEWSASAARGITAYNVETWNSAATAVDGIIGVFWTHADDTNIHISATDRINWDGYGPRISALESTTNAYAMAYASWLANHAAWSAKYGPDNAPPYGSLTLNGQLWNASTNGTITIESSGGSAAAQSIIWPIVTAPTATIPIVSTQAVYRITLSTASTLSNDVSALALDGSHDASWRLFVNCTATQALYSAWATNHVVYDSEDGFTCTGRYEFACSSCGDGRVFVKQIYPETYHKSMLQYRYGGYEFGGAYFQPSDGGTNKFYLVPQVPNRKIWINITGLVSANGTSGVILISLSDYGLNTYVPVCTNAFSGLGITERYSVREIVDRYFIMSDDYNRTLSPENSFGDIGLYTYYSSGGMIFRHQWQLCWPLNDLERRVYDAGGWPSAFKH